MARGKAGLDKNVLIFSKLLEFLEKEMEFRESVEQPDEKKHLTFHVRNRESHQYPLHLV